MNRAERRRQEKEKSKIERRVMRAAPSLDREDIRLKIDYSYERLQELYARDIGQIQDGLSDICTEELLKAEQYMMLGDVMISLKALEMTFGELKTVQRGMNRFLQNFSKAMEYIDKTGIKETYEEMTEKYGLHELVLVDPDYDIGIIDNIWANKDQKVSKIVWEVWKESSKEIDKISDEIKDIKK